ncbi:Uncharacterized protein AC501_1782 [Pseudomonas amygdali pv. lachrymans]|nr:Uncharacterized protein AC501_1782 [Pseudomonas amygdali pv. lachrymans]
MRIQIKLAMQRAKQDVGAFAQRFCELLVDPTNLGLPRQKHQQTAGLAAQRIQYRLHDTRLDEFTRLKRTPPLHRHRKHPPVAAHYRRIVQQRCQPLAFQRGRHQQNLQRLIVTKQLTTIEAQGQCQIGVQTALMKLIENQQPHTFQRRVVLQATRENPLSHDFNTRLRTDPTFQTDSITHRLTDLLAQLTGQPLGGCSCGQSPRLQHQNGLPGQPGFLKQRERHTRGLARAGRGFEHGFMARGQGLAQGWQDGIDG